MDSHPNNGSQLIVVEHFFDVVINLIWPDNGGGVSIMSSGWLFSRSRSRKIKFGGSKLCLSVSTEKNWLSDNGAFRDRRDSSFLCSFRKQLLNLLLIEIGPI